MRNMYHITLKHFSNYLYYHLCSMVPKRNVLIIRFKQSIRRLSDDSEPVNALKVNYHEECEENVNKQISEELNAFYSYNAIAFHFQHPLVALPGFYSMFIFFSKEELDHATKFMKFQNKRGGQIVLNDIKAPDAQDWCPEEALERAIQMEIHITQCLHLVHCVASKRNDAHLCDFIENEFLQEQYQTLKELQDLLTKVRRVGPGLGVHLLDNELLQNFKNKEI